MRIKTVVFMLLIVLAIVIAACASAGVSEANTDVLISETKFFELKSGQVERFVDFEAKAICWVFVSGSSVKNPNVASISCLPMQDTYYLK
jgi:hypothetical protein